LNPPTPQDAAVGLAEKLSEHRFKGSKALVARDYAVAMNEYDFAIKIMEKQAACKEVSVVVVVVVVFTTLEFDRQQQINCKK